MAEVAREKCRHQVAHRHTLQINAFLVDVIFSLHAGNQAQNQPDITVFRSVFRRRVRAGGRHLVFVRARRAVKAPFAPLHAPDAPFGGIRESHDKIMRLGHHRPRGVDGLPPARHQAAVQGDYQRCLFCGVVAGGDIFVPSILFAVVRERIVKFAQTLRVRLRVVAVFVHDDIAILDAFR